MGHPTRRRVLATTALSFSFAGAGCLLRSSAEELTVPESTPDDDWSKPTWKPTSGVPTADDVTTTTVVSELEIPWDLTFAGEDAFVTERDGGVRRFKTSQLSDATALTPRDAETVLEGGDLPDRAAPGEGGTLGVTAHPAYPDRPEIYVYYTTNSGSVENRVVRYDLETDDLEPILEGIPGASTHNGGRLTFGPDEFLWVLAGDAADPTLAQDPGSLAGAVLRLTDNGEPAPDNPDWGDGDSRTYTLGHRNPQGIDFLPQGTPILAEHGPDSRDEVSVLRPGGNYGWDLVRGGPDDLRYESYDQYDTAVPPVINTGPEVTWAPSGTLFYDDDAIEAWTNRLFVCGLTSSTLFAVSLFAGDVPARDDSGGIRYDAPWLDDRFTAIAYPLFENSYGRLRHLEIGPDGSLFLLTSNRDGRASGRFPQTNDDRIVRLRTA